MNDSSKPLNIQQMVTLLSEKGPLSSIFSGFEERNGQKALLEQICSCFNTKSIGVFEAETGVGKSLAYLLPSIKHAFENDLRVVISTATINLQQQLSEKDAPLALKVLNLGQESNEKIVIVKGRKNYLCLRRFSQYDAQDLFETEIENITKLKRAIADDSFLGSKDSLDFTPSNALWSSICSESDNCLSSKCSFFGHCYVMKMKKKAEEAKVIIANHHLLFSDLQAKYESGNFDIQAVLPSFKHIILDEAHAIEDAARSGFSKTINAFFVKKQLSSLYKTSNSQGRTKGQGLLPSVVTLSKRADLFPETVKLIVSSIEAYDELEKTALTLVPKENTWSFLQAPPSDIDLILEKANDFLNQISLVVKNLSLILLNILDEQIDENPYDEEDNSIVHEAQVVFTRLNEVVLFFEGFCKFFEVENYIFWFEKINSNFQPFIEFYKTPLNLSPFMQEALFKPMDSVICTSATLQISNRFDFFFDNIGLKNFSEKQIVTGCFASPFPYEKSVLLALPVDAPIPIDSSFTSYALECIAQLIEASKGRALVLFTSYGMLREAYGYVKERLLDESISLYYQGQYERATLLKVFKEDISSCLFATESFWTGVDVPGEALSHVILVKLPFEVPSQPVIYAKCKEIESRGGKPFFELSVPQAVIKFKQGFGRLMRSKNDFGVITILDSRLVKKNYGSIFLQSVPMSKRVFANFNEIIYNIEAFFNA